MASQHSASKDKDKKPKKMILEPITVATRDQGKGIVQFVATDANRRVICIITIHYSNTSATLGEIAPARESTDETDLLFKAIVKAGFEALAYVEGKGIRQVFCEAKPNMVEFANLTIGRGSRVSESGTEQIIVSTQDLRSRLESVASTMQGLFGADTATKERIRGNF